MGSASYCLPRLILCSYRLRALSDGWETSALLDTSCLLDWIKTKPVCQLTAPADMSKRTPQPHLTVASLHQVCSCRMPHPVFIIFLITVLILILLRRGLQGDVTHLMLYS